jgi:hypothetical protein
MSVGTLFFDLRDLLISDRDTNTLRVVACGIKPEIRDLSFYGKFKDNFISLFGEWNPALFSFSLIIERLKVRWRKTVRLLFCGLCLSR